MPPTPARCWSKPSPSGDEFLRLQALCSLAWALAPSGRIEESLPVIDQAIEMAADTDKAYRRSYLIAMRGLATGAARRPHARQEDLDLAREVNPAYRDTLLLDFTAQVAWLTGDLARRVTAAMDQIAWDGGVGLRRALGAATAVTAMAEMGRASEAAELQATIDRAFRGRRWWMFSVLRAWSRAMLSSLSGDRRAGVEPLTQVGGGRGHERLLALGAVHAGRSGRIRGVQPATTPWPRRACDMLAGDPGAAWRATERRSPGPRGRNSRLRIRRGGGGGPGFRGSQLGTSRPAGWRCSRVGPWPSSAVAWGASDRERATDALERAASVFEVPGRRSAARRRSPPSPRLGSRGRRKKAELVGPGALSKRELEVARLAAEGCSAREIADRLYIGERTVETHLANAYMKLGVSSKLDLVRRAAELGL